MVFYVLPIELKNINWLLRYFLVFRAHVQLQNYSCTLLSNLF